MSRTIFTAVFSLVIFIWVTGCSGSTSPVLPDDFVQPKIPDTTDSNSSTHLWGYFDVEINTHTGDINILDNRNAVFTANVTSFMNSNPLSMAFDIHEIIPGGDYIDIDIDVALTHPFPGLPQYDGYDVRGVFMGNGSANLSTGDVYYPEMGVDQYMFDDPDASGSDAEGGGPDGYTRWFNITEFSEGGMPLFQYTQGKLASGGFDGTATLCPYRYFADSLDTSEDLWTWLIANPDLNGVFSSGATNDRNYYLRFPTPEPNVKYGYAVIANWVGTEPEFHPSNAIEAVGCSVVDNSDVFYVDGSSNGGNLNLEISVFDWGSSLSAGVMEDYNFIIESTVLSSPYEADSIVMTPVGGTDLYSTYSIDLAADNVSMLDGNEYWVIVEYPDNTYANDFGQPNLVEAEPLKAYFRYPLDVSPDPSNVAPVIDCDGISVTNNPYTGPAPAEVVFDATGTGNDANNDTITYEWDFDYEGAGIFDVDATGPVQNVDYTTTTVVDVGVRVTEDTPDALSSEICVINVDVEIDSCGTPDMPTGLPDATNLGDIYQFARYMSRVNSSGNDFAVITLYDRIGTSSYQYSYGFASIDAEGNVLDTVMSSYGSYKVQHAMSNMAMDLGNGNHRIYYTYTFQDQYLWYVDVDEDGNFSDFETNAGFPTVRLGPTAHVINNITLDEDDNPVVCLRYGQGYEFDILHWDPVNVEWISIDPDAKDDIMAFVNNDIFNRQHGFAYNPVSDLYIVAPGSTTGDNPTAWFINSDGTTLLEDDTLYPSITGKWYFAGAWVDVEAADCRTLITIGCRGFTNGSSYQLFSPRLLRYSSDTTEVTSGDLPYPSSGNYHVSYGDGFVGDHDGVDTYFAKVVGANDGVWFHIGTYEMPDW